MTQSSCLFPHPVALDYENTLVLAIELSNANWVLAAQVPGLLRVKAKQTIEPRTEALWAAINGYRERSRAAGVNSRTRCRHLRGRLVRILVGTLVRTAWCGSAHRAALQYSG